MNIGEKIILLKESMGFKNYKDFGNAVGVNGDWINELSKKETISTVDITRLIKIADYFNITIDSLLKDDKDNWIINVKDLQEGDIGISIDKVSQQLDDPKTQYFYGYKINKNNKKLIKDSIDILKGLVKANL